MLQAIAKETFESFTHSYATVAADAAANYAPGSVEAELKVAFNALPTDKRTTVAATAHRLVNADITQRTAIFGLAGRRTVEEVRKTGFEGQLRTLNLRRPEFATELRSRFATRPKIIGAGPTVPAEPTISRFSAVIDSVVCLDETNPESGQDEILMGGIKIDPFSGATSTIEQFLVNSNFDDGDDENWGGKGRLFASFDVPANQAFPRDVPITVMLAEEDSAGFSAALQQGWAKVSDKVNAAINLALTAAGAVLAGELGAMIGGLVAELVGWLAGEFVKWLVDMFKDDIFNPVTAKVYLPSSLVSKYLDPKDENWTNLRSPGDQLTFDGHGGRYQVNLHWEVAR